VGLTDLSVVPGLTITIAERLRAAVTEGRLRPGQRLVEDELARMLGVSRQPVRHALRLLEAEGLFIRRPRRGVVVAPVAEHVIRHVYDIRAALDSVAARRTAGRLTPRNIGVLRHIVAEAHDHLRDRDVSGLVEADRAFHNTVLEASGNQIAKEIFRAQWNRIAWVMRAVLESGYAHTAWHEHEQILDALVDGDADRAEDLAREHAWRAARMLCEQLARTAHEEQASDAT
jgi:DNA-binding GntR family transcriptional regulator